MRKNFFYINLFHVKRCLRVLPYLNKRLFFDAGKSKPIQRTEGWHIVVGDEEINDELEEFVHSVDISSTTIPTKLAATVQFGYEDGMLAALDGEDFDSYIQSVMTHVQSYYRHSETLGTQIELEVHFFLDYQYFTHSHINLIVIIRF